MTSRDVISKPVETTLYVVFLGAVPISMLLLFAFIIHNLRRSQTYVICGVSFDRRCCLCLGLFRNDDDEDDIDEKEKDAEAGKSESAELELQKKLELTNDELDVQASGDISNMI